MGNNIRVSGMNSGLDTDAIVQALVMDTKAKKESYEKEKTKLEWKQEAWKTINSSVYSLYNKASNLRWSSAYTLKKTTISDATKAKVTATNTAVNGTQKLNVIKTAQSGYLTGGKLAEAATTKTTLAELGYTGGEGTINVDKGYCTSEAITVSAATTIGDLTTQLSKIGLNATLDTTNNRIFVSSKETGAENDFNLIAGDGNGASALQKLGLTIALTNANGSDTATGATYKKYGAYAMMEDGTVIADTDTIKGNIQSAVTAYKDASASYEAAQIQIANLKAAGQSYGAAYAGVQDFCATYGISGEDLATLNSLASLSSTGRSNALLDGDNNIYTLISKQDSDKNTVYSRKNDDGNVSYITKVVTYEDGDGNTYVKKENGTYVLKDDEEITYAGDTADLTEHVVYYESAEQITGKSAQKDADGNAMEYTIASRKVTDEDGNEKTEYYFTDAEGNEYVGNAIKGEFKNGENIIKISDVTYDYVKSIEAADVQSAQDVYKYYQNQLVEAGKTAEEADTILTNYIGNLATVKSFEQSASGEDESVAAAEDSKTSLMTAIQNAYANGGAEEVNTLAASYLTKISTLAAARDAASKIMEENSAVANLAALDSDSSEYAKALDKMVQTAVTSVTMLQHVDDESGAVKIDGCDATIRLNGVIYTNSTNNITVNGITVSAMAETGDGDENAISITTMNDVQGIYDKIKDFLTEYNNVINSIMKQYNAAYNKDYEPLTEDEKEEMSDKEIEKWEEKVKESLLRHDSTLSGVMNAMTSAMFKTVELDEKIYSLSSFGIQTLGYLNSAKNEQYAFHIDGDPDDELSAGKTDKLMAMISENPDTVVEFFKQLTTNLYENLDVKMKSTSMNSAYTIYKDKQMDKDMDNYKKLIKQWETKLQEKEDYYYKKFTAMEKALASVNSTQSSLSGYFA